MAIIYIILALIILCINFKRIPEMFGLIFGCAFNLNAFYGAIWETRSHGGVKRGIYSTKRVTAPALTLLRRRRFPTRRSRGWLSPSPYMWTPSSSAPLRLS